MIELKVLVTKVCRQNKAEDFPNCFTEDMIMNQAELYKILKSTVIFTIVFGAINLGIVEFIQQIKPRQVNYMDEIVFALCTGLFYGMIKIFNHKNAKNKPSAKQ